MTETSKIHPAVWLVPSAMLLLAILPLRYEYYFLLRLVVCGAAAYLVYGLWKESGTITPWLFLFAVIAVLFNPFKEFHPGKLIWAPLDFVAAACFILHRRIVAKEPTN